MRSQGELEAELMQLAEDKRVRLGAGGEGLLIRRVEWGRLVTRDEVS